MHELHPDFKDFLRLLNAHSVRYLVVGGYAVAYHGYVRATGDLDIFVEPSPSNAAALVSVLKEFGFDQPDVLPELFTQPKCLVRLGQEPVKLELMNSISGVDFATCHRNRVVADIEGVEVSFINLKELLANKQATGRLKDKADAEELLKRP
jgi:predicted nucleotidyltransferase